MPYTYHTDEDRRHVRLSARSLREDCRRHSENHYAPRAVIEENGAEDVARDGEALAPTLPAAQLLSYMGGGIYDHSVPSAVKNIVSRPEFATAYTPYQPESSQGTLQVIFEFQTHISRLTRLPVANASMYDGASALAEACLMAAKITHRDVVLSRTLPRYLRVIKSYLSGQKIEVRTLAAAAAGISTPPRSSRDLGERIAAVVVRTPNFGVALEQPWQYATNPRGRRCW
jgi:glycine dehydrogenase subunit 1